jgi:hypothetical protein
MCTEFNDYSSILPGKSMLIAIPILYFYLQRIRPKQNKSMLQG